MEREVEASLSVLNSPWGDGTSLRCLADTWERTKLFRRADAVEVQPIISIINTKLSSQTEKLTALRLLLQICKHCSDSVMAEHGASYIQQVARLCEKHNNQTMRCLSLLILRELSLRADKFPNMSKSITGFPLTQIVDCLNDSSSTLKMYACHALYGIFAKFSGSCGSIKSNVEQRLIEIITLNDKKLALSAARCFARLPLTGGGGVAQQGHQAAFILAQKRTIGSLHLELDALYEGIHELPLSLPINKNDNLALAAVNEAKPTVKLQKLAERIRFLCFYLDSLLLEPMSIQKGILVQDLLGLICRALGVTGLSLGSSQLTETQLLRDLIPTVHSSFYTILTTMTDICGTNLLVHQDTVYQIMKNALMWTATKKESNVTHSFLRKRIYECLTAWMAKLKGASGVENFADILLPHIFQDVTPEKETVVLKAVKQPVKRKKGNVNGNIGTAPAQNLVSKTFDSELCCSALDTLNAVIHNSGNLIKASHHKLIQNHVVNLLVDLQRELDPHPLYDSVECQLRLYEILQSVVLFCHPQSPPPTVYAMTLFSAGQMNNSREVSRFCQQAVQIVQRVSFPVYPSLAVQMEPSTEEENLGFGFETEKAAVEKEDSDKSDAESEEIELAVSDKEPEAATESAKETSDDNYKSDSDLEVLEEIAVTTQIDIASAEEEEEDEDADETLTEKADAERSEDDVELLEEQPAKKARQEEVPEVPVPCEEVESMLADFVG